MAVDQQTEKRPMGRPPIKVQPQQAVTDETSGATKAEAPPEVRTAVEVAPDLSVPRAVVIRSLQGPRMYDPYEVIEIGGMRRKALINDRRLRELQYGEKLYRCACGRLWVGQDKAERHGCSQDR